MNIQRHGEFHFIKVTGIVVYSRFPELLFEGLMIAMIEHHVRQDVTNTVTVEVMSSGNAAGGMLHGY